MTLIFLILILKVYSIDHYYIQSYEDAVEHDGSHEYDLYYTNDQYNQQQDYYSKNMAQFNIIYQKDIDLPMDLEIIIMPHFSTILLLFRGMSWFPFLRKTQQCQNYAANPKDVSDKLMKTKYDMKQDRTQLLVYFLNFVLYDMSLIKKSPTDENVKGYEGSNFYASSYIYDSDYKKQIINGQTSQLDLSVIYGGDQYIENLIRTFEYGLIHVDEKGDLPNYIEGIPMIGDFQNIKFAGEIRANENPGLLAIITLFHKNHNHWARQIYELMPWLDDERIFKEAQKRNIAEYQHIVAYEMIPALVGIDFKKYQDYNEYCDVSTSIEFADFVQKYIHSTQGNLVYRLTPDLKECYGGDISINAFPYNSKAYLDQCGVASILQGMSWKLAQKTDLFYNQAILEFGKYKQDQGVIDYVKAQDHEIACYQNLREGYGLNPKEIDQITSDYSLSNTLKHIFYDDKNLHSMIGCLAEDPVAKGFDIGELLSVIIIEQFHRSRQCDRLWFERDFCQSELKLIQKTSISQLIKRNFDLKNIHPYPFLKPPSKESYFKGYHVDCNYQKDIDILDYEPGIQDGAYFDEYTQSCQCHDENAYFISYQNRCQCMFGYRYSEYENICIRDYNVGIYGDYAAYHMPQYYSDQIYYQEQKN